MDHNVVGDIANNIPAINRETNYVSVDVGGGPVSAAATFSSFSLWKC